MVWEALVQTLSLANSSVEQVDWELPIQSAEYPIWSAVVELVLRIVHLQLWSHLEDLVLVETVQTVNLVQTPQTQLQILEVVAVVVAVVLLAQQVLLSLLSYLRD